MLIKKFISKWASLTIVMLAINSATALASGPNLIVLTHTVEEARITIKMTDQQSGVLTARFIECSGCVPKNHFFDSSTKLINQFGAQRPIEELESWSGNRAMFRYRKADNIIQKIQILP